MATRIRTAVAPAVVVLALLASVLLAVAPPATAQPAAQDQTLNIIKEDELPSNAELAVRLSEETPLADVTRVVISRDDEFADALASGVLQDTSPLLLVPRTGPIPERVLSEIRRTGASSAVILGGQAAVDPAVEQQLADAGIAVERRQGGSRFETAIEIARAEAPDATTAIIARAFPSDPANRTQGFADALGAGAMAADTNWPILLSDTDQLTAVTRDYLAQSAIERVLIVGGTAAITDSVEAEIRGIVGATERISGDTRFETAVEIAKERGTESAADAARVVLVDGTSPDGFAGGFAAAGHAAFFDAPVLLVDGVRLPPETQAFLEPGAAFAQTPDALEVTCVVHPLACHGGREALALANLPLLEVSPSIDSQVQPGQQVTVTLGPVEEGAGQALTVKGSCLDGQQDLVTDGSGTARFAISSTLSNDFCQVEVTYGSGEDSVQQGFGYTTLAPDPDIDPAAISVSSGVYAYGTAVATTPLYVTETISCDGPAGPGLREASAFQARYQHEDFFVQSFSVTSTPFLALPGDTCTVTAETPSGIEDDVLWGLYNWSDAGLRNPLLLGEGRTATFSFDQLGMDVTAVDVVWILETHTADIGTVAPPADGDVGQLFNPEGLPITCDGRAVGQGFVEEAPGATCAVSSDGTGLDVLVVEPGRPLDPAPSATFTVPNTPDRTAVYQIFTGPTVGGGSCTDAPELPFASATLGSTTSTQPVAYHSFYGFAGEALRFRADNATGDFESGLDPILTLFGPDGQLVDSNDDGDTSLNSRIDATLDLEGEYCLEVAGFGDSTGEYLLTADPAPTFLDSGTFDATTPEVVYDYQALAGELAILELRAPGFELTDPLLEVYGPDGSLVAADDDGGGYPNARLEFVVPTDGLYTVRATTYLQEYGAFTIEGSFLAPEQSPEAFSAWGGRPQVVGSGSLARR